MMSNHQEEEKSKPKLPPVVKRIENGEKMPTCVILVGMAGSGKTTLLTQLQRSLDFDDDISSAKSVAAVSKESNKAESKESVSVKIPDKISSYCVNLDPATISMPYDVSIDICDTINYKEVMKQHKLGPNGAIMTSLNLFATKFDQVMKILEKRAYGTTSSESSSQQQSSVEPPMDFILVDTPGQIEAFTWSASGSIIGESLASAFPTVLVFVVDTVRCASSPNTFMSNMLYAASMLYRSRLPLVVCFNKTDVVSHDFCLEWMRDYEAFQQALDDVSDAAGFYGSLTRSLSLVLDEFYSNFANACGVSAVTGDGIDDFWKTVQKAAEQDFAMDYIDDLKNRVDEQAARRDAMARNSAQRLQRDLEESN